MEEKSYYSKQNKRRGEDYSQKSNNIKAQSVDIEENTRREASNTPSNRNLTLPGHTFLDSFAQSTADFKAKRAADDAEFLRAGAAPSSLPPVLWCPLVKEIRRIQELNRARSLPKYNGTDVAKALLNDVYHNAAATFGAAESAYRKLVNGEYSHFPEIGDGKARPPNPLQLGNQDGFLTLPTSEKIELVEILDGLSWTHQFNRWAGETNKWFGYNKEGEYLRGEEIEIYRKFMVDKLRQGNVSGWIHFDIQWRKRVSEWNQNLLLSDAAVHGIDLQIEVANYALRKSLTTSNLTTSNPSSSTPRSNAKKDRKISKNSCHKFNEGKKCVTEPCFFSHYCSRCKDKSHGVFACKKKEKESADPNKMVMAGGTNLSG